MGTSTTGAVAVSIVAVDPAFAVGGTLPAKGVEAVDPFDGSATPGKLQPSINRTANKQQLMRAACCASFL
jgi:hypothetical protein